MKEFVDGAESFPLFLPALSVLMQSVFGIELNLQVFRRRQRAWAWVRGGWEKEKRGGVSAAYSNKNCNCNWQTDKVITNANEMLKEFTN